jgi:hypothetical protein
MRKQSISVKDILSVVKNDGRFQGNQKQLQQINLAIKQATGDKSNLIDFANEIKSLIID